MNRPKPLRYGYKGNAYSNEYVSPRLRRALNRAHTLARLKRRAKTTK